MLRSSKQSRREWTRSRQVSSSEIPFRHNRPLHFMIAVFVLAWGGLAISPVNRRDWLLENAVLLLFVAALAILYRFFKFSNRSYLFITLFCILHMVGAHYAYKNTPLDVWAKQIFDTKRGIYDWFVHFAFGLLIVYPVREFIAALLRLQSKWLYTFTFSIIMTSSSLFEIGEMGIVLVASQTLAEEYLGVQGDVLDSQKDMSMTLFGALISIGILVTISYLRRGKSDA
jgi:putative membrane protein